MYNKVIAIGRLVAKPELVKTATDKHVEDLKMLRESEKRILFQLLFGES